MRISTFLLFFCIPLLFAENSYSQKARVTIKQENVNLETILNEIVNQTDYLFLYNGSQIDTDRTVSVSAENMPVSKLLSDIFSGTKVKFVMEGTHIVLTNEVVADGSSSSSVRQTISVTGVVTDDLGVPLPGVTVVVKGTNTGAVTDFDGRYSIAVPNKESILVFSFIGFASKEVSVSGQTIINIAFSESSTELDEVIVIGYGTMKKSDLTGSVSSITTKDFANQPVISPSQALLGRSAGVMVNSTQGTPGEAAKIRIRGTNSIKGSNDPLCVIDGYFGDLSAVHPSDIQSVEILKDASATAIYGSKGANGVIIITTKRGTQEQPKITMTANIGYSSLPQSKKYDLLNAAEYAKYVNEYSGIEYFKPTDIEGFEKNGGTDWQDEIFQTGVMQDYLVSVSGGSSKLKYHMSVNHTDQTGILMNSDWKRYAFRANLDAELTKKLTLGVNLNAQRSNSLNAQFGIGRDKVSSSIWQAINWSPTEPVYEDDGSYNTHDAYGSLGLNPLMLCEAPESRNFSSSAKAIGDLKYTIIPGLSFNLIGTIGQSSSENRRFTPQSVSSNSKDNAYRSYSEVIDWQFNALLNYSKTFQNKHNVAAMLGFEESSYTGNGFSASGDDISRPSVTYYNLSIAKSQNINSGYSNGALRSYFARAHYNYDSKYLLTATFRADGSSVLPKGNQFDYFPSVALAWRASDEGFMKDLEIIDNLKFRGSWGITGNQSVGAYSSMGKLDDSKFKYPGSTSSTVGYSVEAPGNNLLKWERTTQIDFGIDLTLLNNRLSIALDYYKKNTDRLLTDKKLPGYEGGETMVVNLGEILNKGFEANINYTVLRQSDFQWNMNLNGFIMKNEVLDTGEQEKLEGDTFAAGLLTKSPFIIMKGNPIGAIYGYKYLGLWKTSEAAEALEFGQSPGDAKYEDLNGDKVYSIDDCQVIGHTIPKFSWGFNNTFSYKNVELNVLLQGVHGNKILNLTYATAGSVVDMTRTVTLREATNRWTPDNQDSQWAPKSATSKVMMNSSQWVQDGGYVKLRNVSLSYYLSKKVIKMADLKLSLSVQNLFTITKYKGYDPEVSSRPSDGMDDVSSGIDFGAYPTARTYTFGVSLDF